MSFYVYTSFNDYYRSPCKSVKLVGIFEDEDDAWDARQGEIEEHWEDDFSDTWVQETPYVETDDNALWDAVDRATHSNTDWEEHQQERYPDGRGL